MTTTIQMMMTHPLPKRLPILQHRIPLVLLLRYGLLIVLLMQVLYIILYHPPDTPILKLNNAIAVVEQSSSFHHHHHLQQPSPSLPPKQQQQQQQHIERNIQPSTSTTTTTTTTNKGMIDNVMVPVVVVSKKNTNDDTVDGSSTELPLPSPPQQPSPLPPSSQQQQRSLLKLRFDYTNLPLTSPFAKDYQKRQKDIVCSKERNHQNNNNNNNNNNEPTTTKVAIVQTLMNTGLGNDLHVYSVSMCTTMEMINPTRLRTKGSWIWNHKDLCHHGSNSSSNSSTNTPTIGRETSHRTTVSPMLCYFPQSETVCPHDNDDDDDNDILQNKNNNYIILTDDDGKIDSSQSCPRMTEQYGGTSEIRAATTEYLFSNIAPFIMEEAERQLQILFGNKHRTANSTSTGTTTTTTTNNDRSEWSIPKNLITVHVRWGDKKFEMDLLPIQHYIDAVQEILNNRTSTTQRRRSTNSSSNDQEDEEVQEDEGVHIYLSTEDPEAVEQFMSQKPNHWQVYIDQYYVEMLPHRIQTGDIYESNSLNAFVLGGKSGLIALGSLLVAMEANDYVITTRSNWSRLMNEIRKNIINPRCNNCTSVIDLLPFEW